MAYVGPSVGRTRTTHPVDDAEWSILIDASTRNSSNGTNFLSGLAPFGSARVPCCDSVAPRAPIFACSCTRRLRNIRKHATACDTARSAITTALDRVRAPPTPPRIRLPPTRAISIKYQLFAAIVSGRVVGTHWV